MLDFVSLPRVDGFSKHNNDSPPTEVTGEDVARMRMPFEARFRLAKALVEGSATIVKLTPKQASLLCRVSPSALCAQHRKPKARKPLRVIWDAAPKAERQDLLVDKIVLALAD